MNERGWMDKKRQETFIFFHRGSRSLSQSTTHTFYARTAARTHRHFLSIPINQPTNPTKPDETHCFCRNTVEEKRVARLSENGLGLALGSKVSLEALAESVGVVAESASGAVASLVVSVSEEDIGAGRALLEGAVRAAEAKVADASDVLDGVPRVGGEAGGGAAVGGSGVLGHLELSRAEAALRAVLGADGTLARHALVVLETVALSGLAVALALVGALDLGVALVGGSGDGDPRLALGAGAEGAVVLSPCGVAVGAVVARALVVGTARAVAGAAC